MERNCSDHKTSPSHPTPALQEQGSVSTHASPEAAICFVVEAVWKNPHFTGFFYQKHVIVCIFYFEQPTAKTNINVNLPT